MAYDTDCVLANNAIVCVRRRIALGSCVPHVCRHDSTATHLVNDSASSLPWHTEKLCRRIRDVIAASLRLATLGVVFIFTVA